MVIHQQMISNIPNPSFEICAEPWQSLELRLILKKTPLKSSRGGHLNSGLKGQNQVLHVLIPFYCFAGDDPNLTKKKKKRRSNLMISVISASFLRLPLQHNTQLSPSHSGLIIKFYHSADCFTCSAACVDTACRNDNKNNGVWRSSRRCGSDSFSISQSPGPKLNIIMSHC